MLQHEGSRGHFPYCERSGSYIRSHRFMDTGFMDMALVFQRASLSDQMILSDRIKMF